MSLADELHRRGQSQLISAVGSAAEQALLRITLDRGAQVLAGYGLATSRLLGGAQWAAGQLAVAYAGSYFAPRRPPDLRRALQPIAVTPESPQATAGLARLWRLLDEDEPEADARESAAFYASGVATGNVHQAERLGLDEGVDAAELSGPVRYRLHPNPGACEWCLFIADTGARYLSADSVPVPHSPANPKQKGGVCRCSPAIGDDTFVPREMEGAGPEYWAARGVGEAPPEPVGLDRITINGVNPLTEPTRYGQIRDTVALSFENIPHDLAERIPSISVQPTGLGTAAADYNIGSNRIRMRPDMFGASGASARERSVNSGWWTPDGLVEPAQQTLTHEIGHFLDFNMQAADRKELRSVLRSKYDITQASAQRPPTVGRGDRTRVAVPTGTPNGYLPDDRARPRVSTYASQGRKMEETVAELWAEYKTAPQPRDQARFVGSYIEAALGIRSAANLGEALI